MPIFTWPFVISIFVVFVVSLYLLKNKPGGDSHIAGFISKGLINRFTINLTNLAKEGKLDPVVGRDPEIRRVIQVLSRRRKNNIILYGQAGIGKTAVVEGLALAIAQKKVPRSLADKVILKLDISSVLAGTKYRGDFEQRFKALLDEIIVMKKQIIVFIDEIHTIVQAGGIEGGVDADDIIKAPLARGELQMVGATTTNEYNKYIASDPALMRRFETLYVLEPNQAQTIAMLKSLRKSYEDYHNVTISDEVIRAIVVQTAKMKNRVFPDKAIDIMDETAAKVRLDHIGNHGRIKIKISDVQEVMKFL